MKQVASAYLKQLLSDKYSDLGPREAMEPSSTTMSIVLRMLQRKQRRGAFWDTFLRGENSWDITTAPRIVVLKKLLELQVKKATLIY